VFKLLEEDLPAFKVCADRSKPRPGRIDYLISAVLQIPMTAGLALAGLTACRDTQDASRAMP
jgi:hypothetical protein